MTAEDGAAAGFGQRVAAAVAASGPLCVGIDPSAKLLGDWGLPDDAAGLRSFGRRCIEALSGVVPVLKPQVAFFERHGAAGFAALEELLREARTAGFMTIADAKRADIGSTSDAYAEAWLDGASPLAADAVTAVPYLGLGSLHPLIAKAQQSGRGVLVVVQSSNPEGRPIQEAVTEGGRSVADRLVVEIAEMNRSTAEQSSSVGAVIGATVGRPAATLSQLGGVILAPGVGAQGATASDVAAMFEGCPRGTVLPSVSRSVLGAGPDARSLRRVATLAREEMAAALT